MAILCTEAVHGGNLCVRDDGRKQQQKETGCLPQSIITLEMRETREAGEETQLWQITFREEIIDVEVLASPL